VKDLKTALRLLFSERALRPLAVLALVLTLFAALLPAVPPYLMKKVIDEGVMAKNPERLQHNAWLYLAAVLVELMIVVGGQAALATLGQRAMGALRTKLFAHMQSLDLSYFEREPRGRILTRLTNDVEALSEMFTSGAVTMIADFIVAIAIVGAMLWLDVKLTLIAFITIPPMVILSEWFRRLARDAFRAMRAQLARLNAYAAERLAGATVLQSFRATERTLEEFSQINAELVRTNRTGIRVDSSLFAIVEAIGMIAVATLIWLGARDLQPTEPGARVLEIGVLVAFIQYVQRFFIPLRDLSSKFAVIQSGLAAAERVDAFMAERPRIVEVPGATRGEHLLPMRFNRVRFSYGEKAVLREVSFDVAAGKKIALIGPTGSGKSTIIKLALRLVEANEGTITFGGKDIKEWPLASMRQRISLVPQDPIVFAATARDNLTGFEAGVDDALIWAAARTIGTDKVLARLPQGLDTNLHESGQNLSSGEAQLVAFTRALLKAPELLILDEATSSIDPESEALVTEGLHALMRGRSAIVIAHRLATLRMCDEILVLHEGKITERGTHEELLAHGGLYAALYKLQFRKAA
jgi:ATP-binding cassette, subfamily B, multidrug efflux pump